MIVFLNPNCSYGAGRSRWEKVKDELFQRIGGFVTEEIQSPDKMNVQVQRVLQNGENVLIAAGGDGTVNLLLNAVMNSGFRSNDMTIGAVGLGSSNDFHKPFRPDAFLGDIPIRVQTEDAIFCDVIRISYQDFQERQVTRYCLINASIGITAEANAFFNSRAKIVKAARKISVNAAIVAAALKTICSYDDIPCQLTVDDRPPEKSSVTNLGIIKNPHFAGTLCYDTDVKPNDGLLGINLCENMSLIETIGILMALSKHRFHGRRKTRSWMGSQLSVRSKHLFALEMDGEVVQTKNADFSVIAKAVRCCR